ncbi:MAG: TspO/MBR family protein [Woeseiaceae bacterium]|nr:TspO/MBR family protein [Woeseiaceae bacterium]
MLSRAKQKNSLALAGWLLLTFVASVVGARASTQAPAFYAQLDQPAWAPPAWLFGPVWTTLFALMAISAWLVWLSGGLRTRRVALALYVVQLAMNALWSWLFFAWQLGALAFAEVVLLWFLILATLVAFWRIRVVAGVLLVPYLAWVGFAAILNFALWLRNPALLGYHFGS